MVTELISNYIEVITQKYAKFDGRARRQEFWHFYLANIAVSIVLGILSRIPIIGFIIALVAGLFSLAIIIPTIALGIRRMHDLGKPGVWLCVVFIPLVGAIWYLILAATEGQRGDNAYGPDPKA